GNPDEFFALSYPTQGLKDMMSRAFGRLSGAKIEGSQHGVIRSETSFGGGKTHSLIAVTHVAKGARPSNLSEFVDPSLVPDDCQVAAIVADTLDPVNGLTTNRILTLTTRQDAFGKETAELKGLLDDGGEGQQTFQEAQSVVARFTTGSSIVKPASDEEIAQILKRRLFDRVDSSAAVDAGAAYR